MTDRGAAVCALDRRGGGDGGGGGGACTADLSLMARSSSSCEARHLGKD